MSAIDNARAALVRFVDVDRPGRNADAWILVEAMRVLIAEHERLTAEMQQRELHHFETEALLTRAGIDPDGKSLWEYGYTSKWGIINCSSDGVRAAREADAMRRSIDDGRESGNTGFHGKVVRRLKPIAGPWEPLTIHTDGSGK